MGSTFKRTHKRPIPKNAEIVTQRGKTLAVWTGKDGRTRKAPLTEDGKRILSKSKTYYIKYLDENELWQTENTEIVDFGMARQVLQAREKRVSEIKMGILDPAVERLQKAASTSLTKHIDDFEQFMKDKGGDPKHVDQTVRYVKRITNHIEAAYYNNLTTEGILGALRHVLTEKVKARRGHDTREPRTANAHLVAIKSFCGWMVRTKRAVANPAETLEKFPESSDQRHERRAMTGEEFSKLFEAAYNSPGKVQGIDGPTRAMIYMVAALTGLRRKELASLTRADFRLDELPPVVRIQGAYSKNKKTDEIPLHPTVVERLQAYFDRSCPVEGEAVFPLRAPGGGLRATSKMMKADLKAARATWIADAKDDPKEQAERSQSDFLKYSGSDGIADFHSNRVMFITSLCRSNVGLVTAQKLARHSDPKLTSNVYSKVSTEERALAVNGIEFKDPVHQECTTTCTTEALTCAQTSSLVIQRTGTSETERRQKLGFEKGKKTLENTDKALKKPVVITTGYKSGRPAIDIS